MYLYFIFANLLILSFSVLKPEYMHSNTGGSDCPKNRVTCRVSVNPANILCTYPGPVSTNPCSMGWFTPTLVHLVESFWDRDVCKKHWHSGEVITRCQAPAFIRNFKAWMTSAILRTLQFYHQQGITSITVSIVMRKLSLTYTLDYRNSMYSTAFVQVQVTRGSPSWDWPLPRDHNCIRPSTSAPWKPILRLTTINGPQLLQRRDLLYSI